MEELIDVKDIPLPGEDQQKTTDETQTELSNINTNLNNETVTVLKDENIENNGNIEFILPDNITDPSSDLNTADDKSENLQQIMDSDKVESDVQNVQNDDLELILNSEMSDKGIISAGYPVSPSFVVVTEAIESSQVTVTSTVTIDNPSYPIEEEKRVSDDVTSTNVSYCDSADTTTFTEESFTLKIDMSGEIDDKITSNDVETNTNEPVVETPCSSAEVIEEMTDRQEPVTDEIKANENQTDSEENVKIELIHSEAPKPEEPETTEMIQEEIESTLTLVEAPVEQQEQHVYIIEEKDSESAIIEEDDDKAFDNKVSKSNVKDERHVNIPCHVLGRTIDNPQEDLVRNGRTPPKPRLGVKVPYRNLTSQIVSKQDIANELIERVSKRNPQPDLPLGGDIFFAQKLTQRLANKLAKKDKLKPNNEKNDVTVTSSTSKETVSTSDTNKTISDNSDLLAILEGDVDVDWAKEVRNREETCVEKETVAPAVVSKSPKLESPLIQTRQSIKKIIDPETEREIALKQLEEIPKYGKRSLRGRTRKQNLQEQIQEREIFVKEIELPAEQTKQIEEKKDTNDNKPAPVQEVGKIKANENSSPKRKTKNTKEKTDLQSTNEINEVLPTLSTKKVTKTYSRKETLLVEVPEDLARIVEGDTTAEINKTDESQEAVKEEPKDKSVKKIKKVMANKDINKPEVNLVSKRARVIKKKVIWDPDEVSYKNPSNTSPKKVVVDENVEKTSKKSPKKEESATQKDEKISDNKQEEKKERVKETEKSKQKTDKKRVITKTKILKIKKGGKQLLLKKKLQPVRGVLRSGKPVKKSLVAVKNKKLVVKPKKTELDKLLGDEGAVNMLYTVNQSIVRRNKIKSMSKDRSQKDLQNRTRAVREVIKLTSQEDTPKALRKKDSSILPPPPMRKKSRDSLRSSLQSPPPSPSFIYPRRAEASRIIRRHSSSFSSDSSSPRRLSTDQTEKSEKTEENKDVTEEPKRKRGVPIYIRKNDETSYKGKQKTGDKEAENEKNDVQEVKEKLTSAEKRKLNTEMIKNFSQQSPKKRTRSSKVDSEEVVDGFKPPTKSPVKAKKVDHFSELIKSEEHEKQRVSSRQIAMANNYKEISVRKIDNLVQIILTPTTTKIKNAVNLQVIFIHLHIIKLD